MNLFDMGCLGTEHMLFGDSVLGDIMPGDFRHSVVAAVPAILGAIV